LSWSAAAVQKGALALAAAGALLLLAGLTTGSLSLAKPGAALAAVALAIGLGAVPPLRGYRFTAWIVAAVVCAMLYPARFSRLGPYDLRDPWLILAVVQMVMFGMGTQMSLRDLAGVLRMPYGVFVGLVCQFAIMPLLGYTLARGFGFGFEREIAAGIVLIGSCSSGLASNVMAYLAGANLALSITLTACATLLAPLMTPLWMKLLAGEFIAVGFFGMMISIIRIVIVPVGAALLHDGLKTASPRGRRAVHALAALGLVWLAVLGLEGWGWMRAGMPHALSEGIGLLSFGLGGVIAGVAYHHLVRHVPAVARAMAVLSMFGIVYFTTVTTAAGRDELLRIGWLLFVAAILHNTGGYVFGYGLSRLLRLSPNDARTVALEVGLQNGGLASGIAGGMGKLGTVGLAAAIFSPWMNVSGSVLANHWRKQPTGPSETPR
jgi:BASS family bile acid:Na+ symporter